MRINGEEIIAVESDAGFLCPSCWLQKTTDDPDDDTIDYYITKEQAIDLIGKDEEVCNECGCPIGGYVLD